MYHTYVAPRSIFILCDFDIYFLVYGTGSEPSFKSSIEIFFINIDN